MCQQDDENPIPSHEQHHDPFPWSLGAYDAHCHPTDTPASIPLVPSMRARVLTIMATRSQDQHLVSKAAESHGFPSSAAQLDSEQPCRVVPAFGWHPWFSYQLYDDTASEPLYTASETSTIEEILAAKTAFYASVLVPPPSDKKFIASLPTPTPLSAFLASTRKYLTSHPLALVGEIGLDKEFRLPQGERPLPLDESLTPGGREGRGLSPQRVSIAHQRLIMKAQLALAGELGRAVSVHGVGAHGLLYEAIEETWKGWEKHVPTRREKKLQARRAEYESDDEEDEKTKPGNKPFPPRICLHSFSGTVEVLKQWMHPSIPAKIFVSFSTGVNMPGEARQKVVDVVKAAPADRVLLESDLHTAGEKMDAALEDIYRKVCGIKGWNLEEGVKQVGKNYQDFLFG